jgi:hypothetical protein
MTLIDKTELVLEVLRGAEVPALAQSQKLSPHTINRWVRSFLRAGIGALHHEERTAESHLAPIIPLYPDRNARGKRRRSARRGGH